MKKKRRKTQKTKIMYLIQGYNKIKFNSITDIAQYLQITYYQAIYAYRYKKKVKGYIITDHTNIRQSAYEDLKKKYDPNKVNYGSKITDKNIFYIEHDKFNSIERSLIGFDSYTGISQKSVDKFKPTWILSEEQAEQHGLQQIFTGGTLYIDKGKRIYKKDGDKYYQITMNQQ